MGDYSFFLVLGLLTLVAYLKIGIEHLDNAGSRYNPTAMVKTIDNSKVG
jgi:fumarate reductase subunit C